MPSQPKIAADGIFGPKTKAATQAFQRWAHITADGIVGSQTRAVAATALSSASLDPNPHLKPVLREGSRGAAVTEWQSTLNKLAAAGKPSQPKIAADGIFGPKTKAATQAFQRWAHITADGIVGVQTYTAAAKALG
jgi:peptidoglycan hydrolase-like protein with peptidoglycan-binding domain